MAQLPIFVRAVPGADRGAQCVRRHIFYIVHNLFIDDFILSLSRITDRAQGWNSNLSLGQLVVTLDPQEHAHLINCLAAILTSLGDKVANLRKHRDKRVAHRDLSVALSAEDILPSVSRE